MSIYIEQTKLKTHNPRVRQNRTYLLSASTAEQFNTYFSFDVFPTFSDITDEASRAKAMEKALDGGPLDYKVGTWGVRSIFNRYGAIIIGGEQNSANDVPDVRNSSEIRISNNAPLIDTPKNREEMRYISRNCTIRDLVEDSKKGILGRAIYSYADFMYCKHLGKMPNNYLVTLRRFPTPPDDYISNAGSRATRMIDTPPDPSSDKSRVDSSNPLPIGTMVTWLNTPGNNLEDILKYSVSMPYDEKTAQWESDQIDADASQKPLNAIAAMFDKTYRQQYTAGYAGGAVNKYIGKFFPIAEDGPYKHMLGHQDRNKVYGPVDAIKKVYYRGDQGINFDQTFSLTFDYELRSYNGINGKAAMLDLISNILNVTYTTGDFWSGGYTAGGAHQNNIFSNLNIMKCNGGPAAFWDAITQDATNVSKEFREGYKNRTGGETGLRGTWNVIKSIIWNDLGGMLIGGMLNWLGRPQKAAVNSLLSPAATGLWHVTIGNPYHPIMSLGNMVLKSTEISHYGPLGLDDFPTGIKVTCQLERGKPRDLRGIEMIYMNGNDRIYSSMSEMVFEMYEHARKYNDSTGVKHSPADLAALQNGAEISYRKNPKTGKQEAIRSGGKPTGRQSRNVGNTENLMVKMETGSPGADSVGIARELDKMQRGGIKKVFEKEEAGAVANFPSANDYKATKERNNKIVSLLGGLSKTLKNFFGSNDPYSISTGALEQERGSNKVNNKNNGTGTAESGRSKSGSAGS